MARGMNENSKAALRKHHEKGRQASVVARNSIKRFEPFNSGNEDCWASVSADGRKQFVIATASAIVAEFRNGATALIRLRELGSGHILFDRVSRKIIAHI